MHSVELMDQCSHCVCRMASLHCVSGNTYSTPAMNRREDQRERAMSENQRQGGKDQNFPTQLAKTWLTISSRKNAEKRERGRTPENEQEWREMGRGVGGYRGICTVQYHCSVRTQLHDACPRCRCRPSHTRIWGTDPGDTPIFTTVEVNIALCSKHLFHFTNHLPQSIPNFPHPPQFPPIVIFFPSSFPEWEVLGPAILRRNEQASEKGHRQLCAVKYDEQSQRPN